ncbi:hypothetical protein K2Q08_00115 [Patescibacteria group bacterium]|nr:hypothetical protein [Patescibacteria group bacterium]
MKLPTNTKPWIQGAVAGAVLCAIVGFTWGGWVTGSTARKDIRTAAQAANVSALASVCAAQFRGQQDAAAKLEALSKVSTWDRTNVVEKSGFANVPDGKNSDSAVARACAELLTTPSKS